MQAAFQVIEDYEASGAKVVPVKELTESFVIVGGPVRGVRIVLCPRCEARGFENVACGIVIWRAEGLVSHR